MKESRRTFLLTRVPFLAALGLAACRQPTPPTAIPVKRVEPTVTPLGEHVIEEPHFNSIVETLQNSGVPLFQMCADHLVKLKSVQNMPAEFPGWLHKDSFPLKIIINEAGESTANNFAKMGSSPFKVQDGNSSQTYYEMEYYLIEKTILALPPHVKNGGYITEGIYLAKELLTHLVSIKTALEFYDVMHPDTLKITDKSGAPLLDKKKQQISGATIVAQQSRLVNNDVYRIIDALPIFLIADSLQSMRQQGKNTPPLRSIVWFEKARDILVGQQGTAGVSMRQLSEEWVSKGTFLPPDGTTLKAFSNPIYQALITFQKTHNP